MLICNKLLNCDELIYFIEERYPEVALQMGLLTYTFGQSAAKPIVFNRAEGCQTELNIFSQRVTFS